MTDPTSFKCPWCDYSHLNLENSLRIHASKTHRRSSQELFDLLFCPNGRPTCKCGCGTTPKFFGLGRGYGEWLRGHVSRVTNNWGHNEKALEKSHATCNEMRVRGEMPAWNKGLTVETDTRVEAYGAKISDSFSSGKKTEYSRRLTRNRLDGTVPTLRGSDHPNWKGGLSSINQLAHSLLFNAWSRPKMVAARFACSTCATTGDLCVHHDRERFSDLLREAAHDVGYDGLIHDGDFDKKSEVARRLVAIHLERDTSGIVLCRECHAREHERLGDKKEAAVIRSGVCVDLPATV